MFKQILKIILAAFLLVILITKVDIANFYANVKTQNRPLLILAFFSVPIWVFLKTLKWKILLQTCVRRFPFFHAMRSLLAGVAIGIATPGKIGELSRTFFVHSENKSMVVGLVILDRYFDLLFLVFLISFGTLHFLGVYWGISLIFMGFIGIGVLFAFQRMAKKATLFKGNNFVMCRLLDMLKALEGLNISIFLLLFALTGATICLSVMTSYCLLLSFTPVSFMTALNVFPLVLMTNILPITFGNLGVREGATIFLLSTYGVQGEISLNAALSLFVLHTLIPALMGIIFIQFRNKKPEMNNTEIYEN